MRGIVAGILGGALTGIGMTALMLSERRSESAAQVPPEHPEEWSGRIDPKRPALIGAAGKRTWLDDAGHFAASAGFGATYAMLRRWVPGLPSTEIGAAYGVGVYAIDLADAVPIVGAKGERSAGQIAGRTGLYLMFGAATALAMAIMTNREPAAG